jgi:hypothetical protein
MAFIEEIVIAKLLLLEKGRRNRESGEVIGQNNGCKNMSRSAHYSLRRIRIAHSLFSMTDTVVLEWTQKPILNLLPMISSLN